ncbi:MAG TPA: tetratricopeptide repeat protein [Polyangia bacterium]|nr:tetratricopeptide repeat protein [Polyangia bacterium]
MIAAKALMKLEKPAEAAELLEPAAKLEGGKGRAHAGLALAYFASGKEAEARAALETALETNPHYGKTLLGRVRRRVENIAAAQPGSLEEALLYTQTYGDVWTDAAKKFLEGVVDSRPRAKAAPPAPAGEESASAG